MTRIESAANARFRTWRDLLSGRGVRQHGRALLPGQKLIDELIEHDPARVTEILLGPRHEPTHVDLPHAQLGGDLFRELDVTGTDHPLAVVTAPALEPFANEPPRGLELILALSDPGNLGACLRSAEAFGVRKIILTSEASSPYLPKALRAAAGSTFRLNIVRGGALAELRLDPVVGLDQNGVSVVDFDWPTDIFLGLGEEGRGLPAAWTGPRVSIPMLGRVESLNATVAASLAMFAYTSQWAFR